ncbi:DUF262 domain-containing protein [Halonotius sp. F2-221B]|uniref:DUF262 domain-containing protein n=1 Tax=Halonotius sp. F2-221B TaxID=2731620 RepID=UPI00398AB8CD
MEAKFRTVRELFEKPGAQFEVPPYQRGYEWDKKEFEDLWLDLSRIGDEVDRHYLGNIILLEKERGELFEIVDGQQRMVTVSILLLAIRDETIIGGNEDRRITNVVNSYPKDEKVQRLILNDEEMNESYRKIWQQASEEADKRVKKAYNYYIDKVQKLDENEVDELLTNITTNLEVVRTRCNDTSLAYTIFQSQNERGKEVAPHILAKSRIHGAAEKLDSQRDEQEAKNRWGHIYDELQRELGGSRWTNDEIKVRRPMAQILLYADAPTPFRIDKGDLYRNFEQVMNTFSDVTEFVDWFHDQINSYLQITSNQYDVEAGGIPDSGELYLRCLNSSSTQAEVLSHAIYRRVDDKELLKEYLRLAAVIGMRHELAGSDSATKRDILYNVAQSVREADDNKAIRRILRKAGVDRTPEKGEIKEHLKSNSMNYGGPWQFRTLLALVSLEEGRQKALRVNLDSLHIDHIAPRRIHEDNKYSRWRKEIGDPDEFEEVKNLIGNLTLLLPEEHGSLDESKFESKKSVYNNADLEIAREVGDYDEWNIDKIRERTELLAEELSDIWSV